MNIVLIKKFLFSSIQINIYLKIENYFFSAEVEKKSRLFFTFSRSSIHNLVTAGSWLGGCHIVICLHIIAHWGLDSLSLRQSNRPSVVAQWCQRDFMYV